MNGEPPLDSGQIQLQDQIFQLRKCFIGHSRNAPWAADLEYGCEEALPSFLFEPWYPDQHFDPTIPLQEKIVEMIAAAQYGVYDLSYWRKDDRSSWEMPRDVFVELGIAIALNRPSLLLQHSGNRTNGISLPQCLSNTSIRVSPFAGLISLKNAIKETLTEWSETAPSQMETCHYCWGDRVCPYYHEHPFARKLKKTPLHCQVSYGNDVDSLDFCDLVEKVMMQFNDITLDYIDKIIPSINDSVLCSFCHQVRSTPVAIYRITPQTKAETFMAIGMSIALEKQFGYKIPKILLARNEEDIPILLRGYDVFIAQNYSEMRRGLRALMPAVIQRVRTRKEREAVKVFLIYAHKDERLLNTLESQLSALKREGLVTIWHDRNIDAGDEWEHEIHKYLNTASIILLLITPDFMASDYCYNIEMKKAIERHERGEARVIPIILRPTNYGAPLNKLKALPTNGKPVTTWENQDEAFLQVVEGIRQVAEQLMASC